MCDKNLSLNMYYFVISHFNIIYKNNDYALFVYGLHYSGANLISIDHTPTTHPASRGGIIDYFSLRFRHDRGLRTDEAFGALGLSKVSGLRLAGVSIAGVVLSPSLVASVTCMRSLFASELGAASGVILLLPSTCRLQDLWFLVGDAPEALLMLLVEMPTGT
jgi:hypothetical protein